MSTCNKKIIQCKCGVFVEPEENRWCDTCQQVFHDSYLKPTVPKQQNSSSLDEIATELKEIKQLFKSLIKKIDNNQKSSNILKD